MWTRNQDNSAAEARPGGEQPSQPLKEALRQARIDSAERSGVIVEMRDAEAARLELLNEQLDPVFAEIPSGVELFDRGMSRGDVPRLWIDPIAFVAMGRDKRVYRFVQDTRYGRKVIAESPEISDMVGAVTRYIAGRMVERERALASDAPLSARELRASERAQRRQRWRSFRSFLLGIVFAFGATFALVWLLVR
jgi:hypothetical protein